MYFTFYNRHIMLKFKFYYGTGIYWFAWFLKYSSYPYLPPKFRLNFPGLWFRAEIFFVISCFYAPVLTIVLPQCKFVPGPALASYQAVVVPLQLQNFVLFAVLHFVCKPFVINCPGLWIRIHLIRIRIQHFGSIRIRIQAKTELLKKISKIFKI
jgi:hypothetical protein